MKQIRLLDVFLHILITAGTVGCRDTPLPEDNEIKSIRSDKLRLFESAISNALPEKGAPLESDLTNHLNNNINGNEILHWSVSQAAVRIYDCGSGVFGLHVNTPENWLNSKTILMCEDGKTDRNGKLPSQQILLKYDPPKPVGDVTVDGWSVFIKKFKVPRNESRLLVIGFERIKQGGNTGAQKFEADKKEEHTFTFIVENVSGQVNAVFVQKP